MREHASTEVAAHLAAAHRVEEHPEEEPLGEEAEARPPQRQIPRAMAEA